MNIHDVIDSVVSKVFAATKIGFTYFPFSSLLNFDVIKGTDYVCTLTGDCIIHLVNVKDGDSGVIELKMDATGGYTITFGNEFNKRLSDVLDTTASKDNFISWQKIGNDIIYSIQQVQ